MEKGSINNFWSLNVYEVLVATQLKKEKEFKKKYYEVFFPVNAQSEGIDLILFNKNTKKVVTIQVKGSKPYAPEKHENANHGEGGDAAWFSVSKISPKTDFFILIASRNIPPSNYLVIPVNKMVDVMKKSSKIWPGKGQLHLFFYDKGESKKAEVQCHKKKGKSGIDLSEYLNKKGWDLIKKKII